MHGHKLAVQESTEEEPGLPKYDKDPKAETAAEN